MRQIAARSVQTRSVSTKTKIFPGVKRATDLVIERGNGCRVWTETGEEYFDATSGIGVLSTGHCHPTVVKAVQDQATVISHAQQGCYFNSTTNRLMERLQDVVPPGHDSFCFANSGGEAVENALRLARHATGKDQIISFIGGYHGRSSGALACSTSNVVYRGKSAGPLPSGSVFVPYPYEYAGTTPQASMEALNLLLKQQVPASEIAAVIIEPMIGEGGYVMAPPEFMQALRSWCDQHEILLIADEIQCGMGRTGKMWAFEHSGIVPDILVSAKGIASGYPLSMTTTRADISAKQIPGCMGGTYGGNPVACAAAMAVLDVFKSERLMENAHERGMQLKAAMGALASNPESHIGDIRGEGLMVGLEFTKPGMAANVLREAFERNVLLLPAAAGIREVIRVIPPLVISEHEMSKLINVLKEAVLAAANPVGDSQHKQQRVQDWLASQKRIQSNSGRTPESSYQGSIHSAGSVNNYASAQTMRA